MKTKIVLCPTLKFASYEWHRLVDTYPDMWVKVSKRNPMSLTSKYGVKYVFYSENETDKLKGLRGDFISWNEIDPRKGEVNK